MMHIGVIKDYIYQQGKVCKPKYADFKKLSQTPKTNKVTYVGGKKHIEMEGVWRLVIHKRLEYIRML